MADSADIDMAPTEVFVPEITVAGPSWRPGDHPLLFPDRDERETILPDDPEFVTGTAQYRRRLVAERFPVRTPPILSIKRVEIVLIASSSRVDQRDQD